MTFWGVEVKPNKPFTLEPDYGEKLVLTQATLGLGSSSKKSVLQVTVGDAEPVFLCSLLPNKSESSSLNLEFDEDDEVKFSVVGETSIHLSGFMHKEEEEVDGDDYDSDVYGDDIGETDSEDSEFEAEDDSEDDLISDDDMHMFPPSSVRNSGVVIEEIEDEEKSANENSGTKQAKKKKKESANTDTDKRARQQIVVKGSTGYPVLESEDEDGFPVSHTVKSSAVNSEANTATKTTNEGEKKKKKNAAKADADSAKNLKRKVDAMDHDEEPERNASEDMKNKKKKNKKKKKVAETDNEGAVENVKQNTTEVSNVSQDAGKVEKKLSKSDQGTKQSKDKPAKVRTFPNGLKIEELAMGKPNGRRASPGKKVSVQYTGRLQKTGKIFDSNVGRKPFKFHLGVGQVIKGWDIGVEGMRVGDKRRLMIPPKFGYGADGAGADIPPNAWLVFDVELVDVA